MEANPHRVPKMIPFNPNVIMMREICDPLQLARMSEGDMMVLQCVWTLVQ